MGDGERLPADHRWRPGITEMTADPPGPPAVGTKVREVLQTGGRSYTTDSTVVSVGPGMTYHFAGHGTTGKVEGSRTVVETGPGEADFTYRVELTLAGALRFARPIVHSTMRKGLRGDLQRLRALLEHGDDPGPSG
ncbi:MAG: SRPBCC family protein [Acidimicrobiales bacterium]